MTPPKCRLCEKAHWPRAGCLFGPAMAYLDKVAAAQKAAKKPNTPREGHRVLKGEKPTRSASTERPDPPIPQPTKVKRAAKKKKTKRKAKKK